MFSASYLEHVSSDILDGVVSQIELSQLGTVSQSRVREMMQIVTSQRQRLQMDTKTCQIATIQRFDFVISQVEEAQSFQVVQGGRVATQMITVQVEQDQRGGQWLERSLVNCF